MGGGFPALSSGVLLWEQQSLQDPTIMVAIPTIMVAIPTTMVAVPTTMVVVPTTVDAAGGATAIECAAGNKNYALTCGERDRASEERNAQH